MLNVEVVAVSCDGDGEEVRSPTTPLLSVSSEAGTITLLVPSTPTQANPMEGRALIGQGSKHQGPSPANITPMISSAAVSMLGSGRAIVKGLIIL